MAGANDPVLLSVMLDDSAIEDQLRALEGRKGGAGGGAAGGQAAKSAPKAEGEDPAKKIDDLHKTLKRMVAVALTQNLIQIRSGSIVQSSLATISELMKRLGDASLIAGGPAGLVTFVAARFGAMITDAISKVADLGRGYIQGAARFNPDVMAAMARRNIADLMAEIKLSRITGPAAARALNAERALISDPDRISTVGKLRKLAIGTTQKVTEAEHLIYNAVGNPYQMSKMATASMAAGIGALAGRLAGLTKAFDDFHVVLGLIIGRMSGWTQGTGISSAAQTAALSSAHALPKMPVIPSYESFTNVRDKIIPTLLKMFGEHMTGELSAPSSQPAEVPLIPREWENDWRDGGFRLNEQGYPETARPMMVLP